MDNSNRIQMRKWHDLMYLAYNKAARDPTTSDNFETAMHLAAFASEMARACFERIAHEKTVKQG